ncbi:hypothetical protein [Rhizorhabdus argentea]|uniref:hypothetical protein n=1 Tax=Rhizorhabdus argentea TaxID=1387174 RepID=UPI0030EF31CE
MGSTSSTRAEPPVETLADFARRLATRRAAMPGVEAPRNPGTRRTASKRALLEAIAASGGSW